MSSPLMPLSLHAVFIIFAADMILMLFYFAIIFVSLFLHVAAIITLRYAFIDANFDAAAIAASYATDIFAATPADADDFRHCCR